MLIETYLTIFNLILQYGEMQAWLIVSFLFSLLVFIFTLFSTYITRKLKFSVYFVQFILLQIYGIIFWLFELFYYNAKSTPFFLFIPLTYLYIIFVFPLTLIYNKIMDSYPSLPWHFMQWLMSLLGNLVFWLLLIFVFQIFKPI